MPTTAQAFMAELTHSFKNGTDPSPLLDRAEAEGCVHSISPEKLIIHFPDGSLLVLENRKEGLHVQSGMFLERRLHEVHHGSETLH